MQVCTTIENFSKFCSQIYSVSQLFTVSDNLYLESALLPGNRIYCTEEQYPMLLFACVFDKE